MTAQLRQATTATELLKAAGDTNVRDIVVASSLTDLPSFRLAPGQTLSAHPDAASPTLAFIPGQDGVQLSADNTVEGLLLKTDPERCALFNDTQMETLGRLVLRSVGTIGAIRLLAQDRVRGGHVECRDVDVMAADARAYDRRPKGYGVEVVAGAFMLWNRQADAAVTITADLAGLRAGRAGAPVRGSGIFVSGAGDAGGRLIASRVETAEVHSHGGIAPGTPDRISGGVFVVHGAWVDGVRNHGSVTTYGPNDMVLDNWGSVDSWQAAAKITSYGPSGIGFVNFGSLGLLRVTAPIETFGAGARGFNVYDGTVRDAEFERIVTHADGAVGIQISRPVGRIAVRRGVETFGGVGDSLVKGVVVKLAAIPFSIKTGGRVQEIAIDGGLISRGDGVPPFELDGGADSFRVTGGFAAISNLARAA